MLASIVLQRRILAWYRLNGRRDLPWRKTNDPYRILVSEVMLQQTQVSRVLPKYREFLLAFPSLRALAHASTREVLQAWQGLGYNRRALNLHRLARTVLQDQRGRLPRTAVELQTLPGLGPYTARAVACLAFGERVALVETNIRKVILHQCFPHRRRVTAREVASAAAQLLPRANARSWNLAIMDYGAAKFRSGRNPNRQATSYTSQSKFQGSRRQLRGRVVAALLAGCAMSRSGLRRALLVAGLPKEQLALLPAVLLELTREGFVVGKRGRYVVSR